MMTAFFDEVLGTRLYGELEHWIATCKDLSPYSSHSYWYSLSDEPKILPEYAIRSLAPLMPGLGDIVGVEWWLQKTDASKGMAWHFDHDRDLLNLTQQLIHPVWASVLYFSESSSPTVILDYSPEDKQRTPQRPPSEAVAYLPSRNRFGVFKGNVMHAVAAAREDRARERVTMPLNWWHQKPMAPICLDTPYQDEAFQLLFPQFSEREIHERVGRPATPIHCNGDDVARIMRKNPPQWTKLE